MDLIFLLSLGLFFGYELHKLVKFDFFYRIFCISSDYGKEIVKKQNSVALKEILKQSIVNLYYTIVIFYGLFTTNNYYLFFILILIGIITSFIFKKIKISWFRKTIKIIDGILSISILLILIINLLFYNMTDAQLLTKFMNII